MGEAIARTAGELGLSIGAALDAGDDVAHHLPTTDVIIDFSSHRATPALLDLAVTHRKPIVIGTTGHSADEKAHLMKIAGKVPCVWAGNFSVGVNLLFALTRRASPSGTAARLLEIILEERKLDASALRHGREGITGERTAGEVGIHALRGGDVVGDHTVMFAALGERIELTHKASDRGIFARGALRAAQWIVHQPAGVYDMQDVLGLK